ncbi:hypothetical protein AGE08_23280 [Salmonella enterica subsp. enterica serovar Kentucky]|nr:hypothetical protein AGE08_23280 [Salmonella enterica subsp. enterica serovar Kentucky]
MVKYLHMINTYLHKTQLVQQQETISSQIINYLLEFKVALIHHLLQHCHTKEVKVIKASLKSLTAETWMLHMLT